MIWRVYLHERTKDGLAAIHDWPFPWLVQAWGALDAYDKAGEAVREANAAKNGNA